MAVRLRWAQSAGWLGLLAMLWLAISGPARADERLDVLLDAGLVYAGYLDAEGAGNPEARTNAFIQLLVDHQHELITPQADLQAVLNSALIGDASGGVVTLPPALEIVGLGLGMVPARFETDLTMGDPSRIRLAQGYLTLRGLETPLTGTLDPATLANAQALLGAPQRLPDGLVDAAGTLDYARLDRLALRGQIALPEKSLVHFYLSKAEKETADALPPASKATGNEIMLWESFVATAMLDGSDGTAPTYADFLQALNGRIAEQRTGMIVQAAAHNRPATLQNCLEAIKQPVVDSDNRAILATCNHAVLAAENPTDAQAMAVIAYFGKGFPAAVTHETTVAWATPLAERGHVEALYRLGQSYLSVDGERALALYSLAAQKGHMDAERSLYLSLNNRSNSYENGPQRAAELLKQAVGLKHDWALYELERQQRARETAEADARALAEAASRQASEEALTQLLGLVIAAVIANAGNAEAPSGTQDSFQPDPCASSRDIFGWSGGDPDVAAAIALGGCAPY